MTEQLEELLVVGVKIKIGKKYLEDNPCADLQPGQVITLIEGYFEEDNGLYSYTSTAPSIRIDTDDVYDDYDSIYHLFGNDLEYFGDCEVIKH